MNYKNGVVRIGEVFYNGEWHNVGLGAEMMFVNDVVDEVYAEFNLKATVTCGIEGMHKTNSLHPKGKAQDYRTWDHNLNQLDYETKVALAQVIQNRLSRDFDVVVEKDHLHIEYDPK